VIEEPESAALSEHLARDRPILATSRLALVEVTRAARLLSPGRKAESEAVRLLASCVLIEVTEPLLRRAAGLASAHVRTLDAIHLASAQLVEPDEMIAYDRRLGRAGRAAGLAVSHPGASG
jgi:predicted nucleic acid-binding protein